MKKVTHPCVYVYIVSILLARTDLLRTMNMSHKSYNTISNILKKKKKEKQWANFIGIARI